MSEEEKLVSEKTVEDPVEPITKKGPRKVEQGKRMAMISKQAKEKKMREKIEAAMKIKEINILDYIPFGTYGLGGSAIVGGYLIYRWLFSKSKKEEEVVKERIVKISPPPKKEEKKFESFS